MGWSSWPRHHLLKPSTSHIWSGIMIKVHRMVSKYTMSTLIALLTVALFHHAVWQVLSMLHRSSTGRGGGGGLSCFIEVLGGFLCKNVGFYCWNVVFVIKGKKKRKKKKWCILRNDISSYLCHTRMCWMVQWGHVGLHAGSKLPNKQIQI